MCIRDRYGLDSIWIVVIISFFIGTVITIQLSINMNSPLIPRFTIGYAAVSYTHLDVYKRQVLSSSPSRDYSSCGGDADS